MWEECALFATFTGVEAWGKAVDWLVLVTVGVLQELPCMFEWGWLIECIV